MNTRAPLVVLDLDHFIDLITKIHILVKQILNTIDEKKLHKNNIETRDFFYPLHKQPILNKLGLFKNERYPNAEYISKNGFYIPSGLGMTKKEQLNVIKVINKVLEN